MTQRLILAVAYNDESIVKMFVDDSDVDLDHRTPPLGRTMLHLAVRNDNLEIARLLIDRGADVNVASSEQLTAMHIAVANRSKPMVELLIQRRAHVNPKVKFNGKTPLYMAVEHDCLDIAEVLLKNGASVEDATIGNTTVLHVALRIDDVELTKLLVDYAPSEMLNVKDNLEGKTPFHLAVESGDRELVRLLLKKGANVNEPYAGGQAGRSNPLRMALAHQDVRMAALLLQHGANGSSDDCLRFALRHRCHDIAVALLESGLVDVNRVSAKDGTSALHAAIASGHTDMVELCLRHGAKVNTAAAQLGPHKIPLLFYAIKRGNADIVQLLLEHGAVAREIVHKGRKLNALDLAANVRSVCICRLLLRRGLIVNPANPSAELAFVVKYIALLRAEGVQVAEENLKLLAGHKIWSGFHNKCNAEIELLKREKLTDGISFFDLLTKDENALAAYARNDEFVREFPGSDYRSRFAIYGESLALNFTKARLRNSLLQKAMADLVKAKNYSLPNVCAKKVLERLSNEDLRSFIKALCDCKLDRMHNCLPKLMVSLQS